MESVLLCVHMAPEREMRLALIARSLGVRFRRITPEEYDTPIGILAGEDLKSVPTPSLPITDEMIVMAGFTNAQIDSLLSAVKSSGLFPIVRKAVLTDTNRFWSCGRLFAELTMEARSFQKK